MDDVVTADRMLFCAKKYDGEEESRMGEHWKKVATELMEDMATDILTSTSCPLFWGEVELPEKLRNEFENKAQDEE